MVPCPGCLKMFFRASAHGSSFCRGFKALKQIVKIHYHLGNTEAMLASYR